MYVLFAMNCNVDVKHEEDPLLTTEIKTEPQDIKSEIKTEAEESEHNNATWEQCHIKTTSEVEGGHHILRRLLEDSSKKSQDGQNDIKVDANNFIAIVGDPGKTYRRSLEEEKPSTCVCRHTRWVNTCSACNKKPNMCTQTADKRIKCNTCNNTFSKKSNFDKHFRSVHKGEKPFICKLCSRSFSKRSNLHIHYRIHYSEKPFTCDICNKSFSQKSTLTTHSRIHTKEKPYTCDICCKSFTQKSILLYHARSHANDKPFTCDLCSKSFGWKSSLTRHAQIHRS